MLWGLAIVLLMSLPLAAQGGEGQWTTTSDVPVSEQLPAAPLLVTAYAIVWLVPMFYLWSIWRRLNKVEREVADLERHPPGGSHS
jgi:CcmD family protein